MVFKAIQEEGHSVRQAAEAFDVPKSTLHNRITGRVPFGKLSGHSGYLSDTEELELVNFLEQSSKVGCARSKSDVLNAKEMQNVKVTSGWWESFKKRHPKLTLRSALRSLLLIAGQQQVIL